LSAELIGLGLRELSQRLAARDVSAVELAKTHLERAARIDAGIGAYLRTTPELAIEQAEAADRRLAAGDALALTGIPMAVKDVLCVRDAEVTAGSRILRGFRPPYDATAVARLREAGVVILGMTNCDEFAMGSSTENSGFAPTRNPWSGERVPGGSSGGSAAAVASGQAAFALGTDTGGSIRQPAALCGVVGMKPTYGRVSRYGLIAFASSLDQVGPITRSVEDAALVLDAITGADPLDSTSTGDPTRLAGTLEADVRGLRLGMPREYFETEGVEPAVRAAVLRAVDSLAEAGAEVVDVALPHTDYGLAAYYVIAPAEASSNLARFDGVRYGHSASEPASLLDGYLRTRREGFGPEVRRRIMLGTYALSSGYYDAYYLHAQKVRTLIKQDFDRAFERCDAVVCPTSPVVAFELGAKLGDPLAMYLNDVFTLGANLAGLPGVSVPCGSDGGLPIGLQVLAPQFREDVALRVGRAHEEASGIRAEVASPA
jgi:aspartyl-tRNA(Asn)/glutamyl-tRNA(Gln) amidotransferase subunit A